MSFRKLCLLYFLPLFTLSCNDNRQQRLDAREKELMLREEQFYQKEADYEALLKMRDSLLRTKSAEDSLIGVKTWPRNLEITWNSKMICTESDCGNYVIGDQRNEVWQFTSDSTGMYANVINNKKLVRVFSAKYAGDKIAMEIVPDSTSANKSKTSVLLNEISPSVIKGTETVTGQKSCTAKFSVELTPSPKN